MQFVCFWVLFLVGNFGIFPVFCDFYLSFGDVGMNIW